MGGAGNSLSFLFYKTIFEGNSEESEFSNEAIYTVK
jgi:hypothetical protein